MLALGLAAVGLIGYRLWAGGFDWARFGNSLRAIDATWMTVAVLLVLVTYVGRALRWKVMIAPQRPEAPVLPILAATIIGFTAIVFFGRAGEIVRPYLIARRNSISLSSQLAVWLLERILDLLMILAVFGVALARLEGTAAKPGPALAWVLEAGGWLAAGTGAVTLAVLIALRQFGQRGQEALLTALAFLPEPYIHRIRAVLASFTEGIECTRRPWYAFQIAAYTIAEWAVIALGFWALLQAFSGTRSLSALDAVILLGFVAFGGVVQIPGIGGGMQIVAFLVLTEMYAIGIEEATSVALFLWLTTFVVVTPAGILLALREGLQWKSLAHLESSEPSETP